MRSYYQQEVAANTIAESQTTRTKFDIQCYAPTIVIPATSESLEVISADLGKLTVRTRGIFDDVSTTIVTVTTVRR